MQPKFEDAHENAHAKSFETSPHMIKLALHCTFWEIEMAKKYPVDFEAAAITPSSRADPQSLNPFMASLWSGSGEGLAIKGFGA